MSTHPTPSLFQKLMRASRPLPLAALIGLTACGSLSERGRNTAIGATVGGVAGSVLTNGGTLGTVGGAVVGGAIGHQVETRDDRRDHRDRKRGR